MPRLDIALRADIAALQDVAMAVEAFAEEHGWPSSANFAVQLCLEEAASNVIRHAVLPEGEGVQVAVAHEAGRIVLEIADPGPPFNPLDAAPPPELTDAGSAPIGGRGILLMRKFCPDIGYRRDGGFNRLRFEFPLPQS